MFEYDALLDQKPVVFAFLENFQKPPGGVEYTARRRMRVNPILGFLWWTAWRQGWLRQATWILCRKCYFFTFCTAGTARRMFHTARRQALIFWALGATNFSSLRSFRKTAFPDSLTVLFKWNFDKRFITCCSSLWTVEIWIGCLQLEIYITHDWLF